MTSSPQPGLPSLDQIEVVLVRPRNPLNIGAAARAMANFGLSHLTVVSPYEPTWREAQSAVGATNLLQSARSTHSVAEAVASATLVLGTASLTYRTPEQPVLHLPYAVPLVQNELAAAGRVALLFGPENHGLNLDDLALCHQLIVIPTADAQPSMNLGQAVAVCLYELSSRLNSPANELGALALASETRECTKPGAPGPSLLMGTGEGKPPAKPTATSAHLDQLAGLIEETMEAANYSPAGMRAANRHDLELILRRLSPNARDLRRILGLFRRILWRLRHDPPRR